MRLWNLKTPWLVTFVLLVISIANGFSFVSNIHRRNLNGRISSFTTSKLSITRAENRKVLCSSFKIDGWDNFGRVPLDEWIFATNNLLNPDLLKLSYLESISQELPLARSFHNRKAAIAMALTFAKNSVAIAIFLLTVAYMISRGRQAFMKSRQRQFSMRGFESPLSATKKGGK